MMTVAGRTGCRARLDPALSWERSRSAAPIWPSANGVSLCADGRISSFLPGPLLALVVSRRIVLLAGGDRISATSSI
jgi:hypothetical protein